MEERNYYYNVGDIVGQFKIINRWYGGIVTDKHNLKRYDYECINCTYQGTKSEYDLKRGVKCPCCCPAPKVVVEHINSIVAKEETRWMIDYFQGGYDEAKLYVPNSHKKVFFKCPYCETLEKKARTVKSLKDMQGLPCLCQSKGGSLPERFIKSLLNHLHIDYINEMGRTTFEWCEDYRYDFYLPDYNMIIETHGRQHYEDCGKWTHKTLEEQQEIDRLKEELAYQNGIDKYVVLDCRDTSLSWLINSLKNTVLFTLFQLQEVDFEEIYKLSLRGDLVNVCNDYNSGVITSTKMLAEKYKVASKTIVEYLKVGHSLGLCRYDTKEIIANQSKNVEVYKDGEFLGKYRNAGEVAKWFLENHNINLRSGSIGSCCRGRRKTHKGLTFKYSEQ